MTRHHQYVGGEHKPAADDTEEPSERTLGRGHLPKLRLPV